jgi:hypothetical protein
MSNTTLARPLHGRRVPDPATGQPLPEGGALVDLEGPHAAYWHRRARDSDVTLGRPPADDQKPLQAAAEVPPKAGLSKPTAHYARSDT